ncbi:MAG: ferredoxin-thioredoxin reductase catalytic domain-containing protein [Promethearchaeota archaeon]
MNKKKSREDIILFIKKVAKHDDWKICPDEDLFNILVDGLTINYNRHGYFSCPCRLAYGNKEQDKDIICPCDYCTPDLKEHGHCYCGLYLTGKFHLTGKIPSMIPERRPESLDA